MQLLESFAFVRMALKGMSILNLNRVETITENESEQVTITIGRGAQGISLRESFNKLLNMSDVPFYSCKNLAGVRVAVNLKLLIWVSGDEDVTTIHLHSGRCLSLQTPFAQLLDNLMGLAPERDRLSGIVPQEATKPLSLDASIPGHFSSVVALATNKMVNELKNCSDIENRPAVIETVLKNVPFGSQRLVMAKVINEMLPGLTIDDMNQTELEQIASLSGE